MGLIRQGKPILDSRHVQVDSTTAAEAIEFDKKIRALADEMSGPAAIPAAAAKMGVRFITDENHWQADIFRPQADQPLPQKAKR